jgi:hypothetical protein
MRFARQSVSATAASLFIIDTGGEMLLGVASEWDWTRTSFTSKVSDWPTVERALFDQAPRAIMRANAKGPEKAWFEPRGIERTVCVPLFTERGSIGVLFFDFETKARAPLSEASILRDVGERTSRAIARAAPTVRELVAGVS